MDAPALKVIDRNFNYLAYINNYESLQFERRLFDVGSFELHINLAKNGAAELLPERIIVLDDRRAGIILDYEDDESDKGITRTVYGVQLKGLVQRRITVPDVLSETKHFGYDRYPAAADPDAPAEDVIKHYVSNHMTSPENTDRRIMSMMLIPPQGRGILMRWSSRFENLEDVLKGIGEWSGMGYDIYAPLSVRSFIFDVLPPVDKTINSNTPVLFSATYGNVKNLKHAESYKNWINAGYCGGAGENEERLIQTVYENDTISSGWSRREAWVDCGSIELVDDLIYEGKYKLKDKTKSDSLSGSVLDTGPFKYIEDFDISDIVTVQSKQLGVEGDKQITAVRESYESGKSDIEITLGKPPSTILETIRRTGVVR